MRTTITIDDAVYAAARREAFETHKSIGEVISEWAKRGLYNFSTKLTTPGKTKSGFAFPSFGLSGNKGGITPDDVKRIMETEGL